ncbi:unnamed protein product [Trifolium pratense]|uniref:Uncharacterized protein n=1 Tax=Trifolium pratense TaxID=57577 RepID=A0ACB0KQY4_TRIPR|nr:unnamed protein product [Trifolium pratense]
MLVGKGKADRSTQKTSGSASLNMWVSTGKKLWRKQKFYLGGSSNLELKGSVLVCLGMVDAEHCHLGVSPSGLPRGASGVPLSDDYFRRIEAIEFTIKQDDGASPQNLAKADIVLTGVDPEKVFGLTINHGVLQDIRKTRAKTLGFSSGSRTNYSEMDYIRGELEFAGRLFAQNPIWPVIDVTAKAVEETAAVVLRLFHDRRQAQKHGQ